MEGISSTPRRSQRKLFLKTVKSFKSNHPYSWPDEELSPSAVRLSPKDQSDFFGPNASPKVHFYERVYRHFITPGSINATRKDEFAVGDTVLVRTRTSTVASIGVIVALWQPADSNGEGEGNDDVDKDMTNAKGGRACVRWFVQPHELPKVRAAREHAANEIFFDISAQAVINTVDILDECSITKTPSIKTDGLNFCCFYALKPSTGVFYVFDWMEHWSRATADDDITIQPSVWRVEVEALEESAAGTASPKKRKGAPSTPARSSKRRKRRMSDSDDNVDDADYTHNKRQVREEEAEEERLLKTISEDDEEADTPTREPQTPSKRGSQATQHSPTKRSRKRRRSTSPEDDDDLVPFKTPTKKRNYSHLSPTKRAAPTPHSKAALRLRQKRLAQHIGGNSSSVQAALDMVGEGDDLSHLPEDGFLRAMTVLHVGARPDTLPCRENEYVDILDKVMTLVEEGAGGCVYISGVPGTGKTATVHAVVRELKKLAEEGQTNPFTYVEVNGLKIPEPTAAYGLLWEALSHHDAASEGHLKISSKEALRKLDRYFLGGGNTGPGAHACVVLMDELDQLMTVKQDVVYNFFNWPSMANSKLIVLAVANTMDLPERVMSGKVQSRLGMARVVFTPYSRDQLVEIVNSRLRTAVAGLNIEPSSIINPDAVRMAAMRVATITGDARRALDICRRAVEVAQALPERNTVMITNITNVLSEMQKSPTAAYLQECSFHERLLIAAIWKCAKKEGVSVVKWGDVAYQHGIFTVSLAHDLDSQRRPSATELLQVLDSLLASRALLMEEARKGLADVERGVQLNLEENEVLRVLGEKGGSKWRQMLGTG